MKPAAPTAVGGDRKVVPTDVAEVAEQLAGVAVETYGVGDPVEGVGADARLAGRGDEFVAQALRPVDLPVPGQRRHQLPDCGRPETGSQVEEREVGAALLRIGPVRVVWNTRATAGSHSHLSILLIPVLLIPEVGSIGRGTRDLLDVIDYAVWAVFVLDYGVRLAIAESRAGFVRHNVPDLLLVVLPMLRPLRGARLLRVLRVGRLAVLLRASPGSTARQTRALTYVGTLAGGSTLLAAVAMDDLERNAPGATIKGFGDSIWWAFTTVSTVGYGDRYPVTTGGRFVAAALMVIGVSLSGSSPPRSPPTSCATSARPARTPRRTRWATGWHALSRCWNASRRTCSAASTNAAEPQQTPEDAPPERRTSAPRTCLGPVASAFRPARAA